ncbi:hypothetical protein RJ55_05902 [Drechmeria coniospora]|nr:hypothetical protein RJ55_05902 [Drechmeria coniospora]
MSVKSCSRQTPRRADDLFRIAVIGSGPAGFYAASRVMSKLPSSQVDMYEDLPVPFGLIRHGVAPDHPEVKNCQERFEEIASSPNFRFIGNTSVGRPSLAADHCTVPLQSLMRHYDSVLLAYGASEDKKLGIPGEATLRGVYSARQFVGWYNGLPGSASLEPDLASAEDVIIVGQGNVALDVARILLERVDVLRKTDISEHALAELARSRVKRVRIAAFTIKETRELMKLYDVAFHPIDRSLIPGDVKGLPRASRRLAELLLKGSSASVEDAAKTWSLDSCLAPKCFLGRRDNPAVVASTEFRTTRLKMPFDPQSSVAATDETLVLPSDLVFRSVGYKSVALDGFADARIPFDERRGVVRNDGLGRILSLSSDDGNVSGAATEPLAGMYCAGWLKTGPTGVIASTMQDSFAVADAIVHDWTSGARFLPGHRASGWEAVAQEVGPASVASVSWDQWHRIDAAERLRGRELGKERDKFTRIEDMLSVLG